LQARVRELSLSLVRQAASRLPSKKGSPGSRKAGKLDAVSRSARKASTRQGSELFLSECGSQVAKLQCRASECRSSSDVVEKSETPSKLRAVELE
jgi:hypothetical protein